MSRFERLALEVLSDHWWALYERISGGHGRRGRKRSALWATMVPSKVG